AALEGAARVVRGALEVGVDRPPGARGTLEGDHRAAALTGEEAAQEVAALDARRGPPLQLAPGGAQVHGPGSLKALLHPVPKFLRHDAKLGVLRALYLLGRALHLDARAVALVNPLLPAVHDHASVKVAPEHFADGRGRPRPGVFPARLPVGALGLALRHLLGARHALAGEQVRDALEALAAGR